MRITKHLAIAVSSLAFAGAAAFGTAFAVPATAAIPAGGGGDFQSEDFVIEEGDFFLNEENDPHHPH
ncbi:hypothetical protein [Actinomadura sp. HBU206391]|uniref:hypothetical protein n=1 Tax=Actinomadura sp. HBU206391 TaxID=2731692 RepID=UPI0016509241|nr:hypothetical protein [Actinomadura sp. HBU206391]MBC6459162.1 hypothetical protein [Actinomadura sp. HBU206391]